MCLVFELLFIKICRLLRLIIYEESRVLFFDLYHLSFKLDNLSLKLVVFFSQIGQFLFQIGQLFFLYFNKLNLYDVIGSIIGY